MSEQTSGPVAPDEDDNAEYLDGQLHALSEKLRARGLETRLVSYSVVAIQQV
jgi:hypothetical protein